MPELKVINLKDVKGERRDRPRMSWVLVSEKTVGAQNLAMGVNETYPGGMVPEHKHDKEEVNRHRLIPRPFAGLKPAASSAVNGNCRLSGPGATGRSLTCSHFGTLRRAPVQRAAQTLRLNLF